MAKRASATVVDRPKDASSSAALVHSASRVPSDSSATLLPLRHDAALADFERHADGRHIDADAVAARIAQRRRTIVDRDLRRDHVDEFGFVRRRHHHEVRQAAQIGDVERTGMGRAVGADEAGAIEREAHRQALDRDVVHDLVIGALQEGRIDRAERLVAFRREPGREGHRMLLGNADIEGALGKRLLENVDAGARRHRRGDRDDRFVLGGFLGQALAEHLGVGRRVRLGLGLRAGGDVELHDAMIFVARRFGGRVALALLRHDMNEHRPVLGVAHILQHRDQVFEIVAVDRTDVIEAEFVEQRAAGEEAAREFFRLRGLRIP